MHVKNKCFFSIIIPTHNRAHLICRSIDSCLNQTFNDFEVIVVDDGSTDNTKEVVESYNDSRVHYIALDKNSGGGKARNYGAENAGGEYLAFLDSDDEFLPTKLESFYQVIISTEDAKNIGWYSQFYFYRSESNISVKPSRVIRENERMGDYLFAFDGAILTTTMVISTELFSKINFNPDLSSHQDLDLCLRMGESGIKFKMIEGPQSIWYNNASKDRVSYNASIDYRIKWANDSRELLSTSAYYGFLARNVSPALISVKPLLAIKFLLAAFFCRSISLKRTLAIIMLMVSPGVYQKFSIYFISKKNKKKL